jgi:superfamily I DNA/RNA helicase
MRLPAYEELSKEQDRVNSLPLKGSHLVIGPPGTGKTVMAIYRSKMLRDKKIDVTLLMYNRLLSQYTRRATKQLGIDGKTDTFHSWFCRYYKRLYGRNPPQIEPYVFDWQRILTKVNSNGSLFSPAKPFIVLDEAQDFPKEFFPVIRAAASDITVFADENQRITEHNSTIQEIKTYAHLAAPIKLSRNYRNTMEIAELAEHFYTGLPSGIPERPSKSGPKPVMLRHGFLHETVEFIVRYERNNSDSDIAVFVQTAALQRKFINRLTGKTKNPVQAYEGGLGADAPVVDFDRPGIKVICYASAKGLEFDVVFLPELQTVTLDPTRPEFAMAFYVLISRARRELFLSYSGAERPAVVDAFPERLLEVR